MGSNHSVKKSKERKTKAKTADFETLQNIRDARLVEYGKSKNTNKVYAGHIARGRKFLADIVAEREFKGIEICDKGIPTIELAKAFDKPPNRYSAVALEFFLVQKVFTEELSKSSAEGIQGAFADYWDKMEGQTYAGAYSLDETTGKVSGCPARAPAIHDLMKAVKTRAATKGAAATRKHAEAMSLEDLQKIMDWSEGRCPNELFDNVPSNPESVALHGLMRALYPTLFVLMLRYDRMRVYTCPIWEFSLISPFRVFEGLSLQYGDLTMGLKGPAPYHFPYFEVRLEERKNWQKQAGYDGPRTSGIYKIYQQDIGAMDMFTHLQRWLKYLEGRLGRSLESSDFIFPHISHNGTIDPKRTMSYDTFQKHLSEFVAGAGLTKTYTTHCFRRGGAQYRFMYAPIGRRWSLSIIRWWGGWAKGEQVDTMIKYLVDSLQSYETGHGNALCPIAAEADKSFMGEHINQAPPSTEEIRQWKISMDRSLGNAVSEIVGQVTAALSETRLSASPSPEPNLESPPSMSVGEPMPQERSSLRRGHSARHSSNPYSAHAPNRRTSSIPSHSDVDSLAGDAQTQSPSDSLNFPIPGVVIPDVKNWRDVVQQWELGDASVMALKDWPKEWYQGGMKRFTGSLYSQRKMIANEYERCVISSSARMHI
ncbi:uncharacterized protein LACBIDRAFT_303868 [Laccaria bicolor S238N-H82]|uniref:Predicted protein n=2 Tax=Laccaria bicolor (strain S238N-H82 / ATCC MYA-4686) TaxID=486041 RepID=B0DKJ2_LACBS|nr:uncharacterized protein LACBIDRAFT_303868 [Laccaria bicolor S238N-H82]EDR05077.1 predicted protein [Laccaria bicolor S238N-H82]|eukprot:XP_001884467.1 predicted protein [Laccaria bicolor S238N-H82]